MARQIESLSPQWTLKTSYGIVFFQAIFFILVSIKESISFFLQQLTSQINFDHYCRKIVLIKTDIDIFSRKGMTVPIISQCTILPFKWFFLISGIVLSWNMTYIAKNHAEIQSYQLFAYQETSAPPTPVLWKKV